MGIMNHKWSDLIGFFGLSDIWTAWLVAGSWLHAACSSSALVTAYMLKKFMSKFFMPLTHPQLEIGTVLLSSLVASQLANAVA